MNNKFAFTLAEVLITLGIIGIVAAMTIPTLLTNYQKKSTAIKAKKAYAELLQAIKLSEYDNESIESWDIGKKSSLENTEKYVEKYIMPYYKGLTLCSTGNDNKCGMSVSGHGANYITLNGTEIAIKASPSDSLNILLYIIIDINGKKKPNLIGYDAFYFTINENNNYELRPYGWFNGITRETIKEGYSYNGNTVACKKLPDKENPKMSYRHGCTSLLMLDNWEIKNDYPW